MTQTQQIKTFHPKLVVFDWDGTILDTTAAIALSIQYACEKIGLPVPSTSLAKSVIGLGWRDAIRIVAPTCPEEDYSTFGSFYTERYRPAETEVHLFPGIVELLQKLKNSGIELAVATGKSRRGLNRVLAQTGLADCFSTTETVDENPSKPNPAMLEAISVAMGRSAEEMVMVGDRLSTDIQLARNAGIDSILVLSGEATRADLAREEHQPTLVLEDLGHADKDWA